MKKAFMFVVALMLSGGCSIDNSRELTQRERFNGSRTFAHAEVFAAKNNGNVTACAVKKTGCMGPDLECVVKMPSCIVTIRCTPDSCSGPDSCEQMEE